MSKRHLAWLVLGLAAMSAPALAETRNLPVATVTLYPGDAIAPELLTEKAFTGSAKVLSAYVNAPAEIAGKFARRTIVAGVPIALAAIKNKEVVSQGVPAAARFEAQGLVITTTLVPLESGGAGDVIMARNPDSGRTVEATVAADGTLLVGAP